MDDRMTTYERRQRIMEMLEQQPVVKVGPLAEVFNVSEGTIRNDLRALEEENQLRRVRGGGDNHATRRKPRRRAARPHHGQCASQTQNRSPGSRYD